MLFHGKCSSSWFLLLLILAGSRLVQAEESKNRFESEIAGFEEQDRAATPAKDGVLFVGSSSIRMWKLGDSFPGESFLNRGFGGSQLADVIHFADRIIAPYQPRVIVLYAGDNDIAAGKSPEQVAADFKTLCKAIHAKSPTSRLIYIGIKPSPARWSSRCSPPAGWTTDRRACRCEPRRRPDTRPCRRTGGSRIAGRSAGGPCCRFLPGAGIRRASR